MQEQTKKDSRYASIHEIISQNKRHLRQNQVSQLFSSPDLYQMDLNQLMHHPYMQTNQVFTYFVQELQKWNRKIKNKQIKPCYHAQLNRNQFVFSTLKLICIKKPNQINHYLQDLTRWYNKNSQNIPQSTVLMKKHISNQDWEIRKTFNSNTTSEINHYRRRFLFTPDVKDAPFPHQLLQLHTKKQNCFFQSKPFQNKTFIHSKTPLEDFYHDQKFVQPFKQVMKNKDIKLAKLQHNEIRLKRQQREIAQIQDSWKSSHSRFSEKACKNFMDGKFNKNRQFIEASGVSELRKVQTALFKSRVQRSELMSSVKKGRIMTSLGIRKKLGPQQGQASTGMVNLTMKTESNEEARQESVGNWIDKFVVDEDIDMSKTFENADGNMKLISNPFETVKNKIKKKKR